MDSSEPDPSTPIKTPIEINKIKVPVKTPTPIPGELVPLDSWTFARTLFHSQWGLSAFNPKHVPDFPMYKRHFKESHLKNMYFDSPIFDDSLNPKLLLPGYDLIFIHKSGSKPYDNDNTVHSNASGLYFVDLDEFEDLFPDLLFLLSQYQLPPKPRSLKLPDWLRSTNHNIWSHILDFESRESGLYRDFSLYSFCSQELSRITDNLYLSGFSAMKNPYLIREKRIDAILNVALEVTNPHTNPVSSPWKGDFASFPIWDAEHANLGDIMFQALDFIRKKHSEGKRVLVNCVAGVSRSTSVVVTYLMLTKKLSFYEAINLVHHRRPIVGPNNGFIRWMKVYSQYLEKHSSSLEAGLDKQKFLDFSKSAKKPNASLIDGNNLSSDSDSDFEF